MRYIIWGPVIGLFVGWLAFTLGMFGYNGNLFISTTVVLAVIGLVAGWFADSRVK